MQLISILASAVVFVMWAISAFSTLFALRRRATARTGNPFPGPADTFSELRIWLRDPMFAAERRRLFVMTIAVMVISILTALSLTPVAG